MPPKLVRPQTFTTFQQPDSASPAVRLGVRTKFLFSLRLSGLCKSIALSAAAFGCESSYPKRALAYPDLPSFLRHWLMPDFVKSRLSVPSTSRVGQQPKVSYHVLTTNTIEGANSSHQ